VQQIFQLLQLNKTRQKMHKEEKRKPSLEHENKQFMTPIQLVIILLERQALLLLYSIFLGQSKDIKEKTSLDNFLVFVFHRLLVLSKVLRVKVN
jgi:hypothetical protein